MSEQTTSQLPAASAHKEVWVEYAITHGMGQEAAEQASKAQLIETFTSNGQQGQEGQEGQQEGQTKKTRTPPPDTSTVTKEAIQGGIMSVGGGLAAAGAPVRERKEEQKFMDEVAAKIYGEWVDAGKPSAWEKLPVVTYFLDDSDLPKYRYLIRRACAIVEPIGDSRGVTVRFGNEFVMSEKSAQKIDPQHETELWEHIGQNVLMWAAVDKRTMQEG
jgi:hypothetical protein